MTERAQSIRAVILAGVMVLSVFGGAMIVAGAQTDTVEQSGGEVAPQSSHVTVQEGSAKALTLSWFRDDGDSNGPYPAAPNEYDGDASPAIEMFTNAEGDAQLRVDNSTALNPNGRWDMAVLHVETSGLDALNPPEGGVVTQNFTQNDNWNLNISQVGGDKTLDVGANQEGYDNPPGVSADVPPVMVLADTEVVEGDYIVDGEPDTGLYVWIDPNRATLSGNQSFQPGEEYEATFDIAGQTESVNFEMVQGDVSFGELSPANTAVQEVSGRSTLSAGTEVELVLETQDGETQSTTVEVEGNRQIGGDTLATIPQGIVSGTFDLAGREGETFTIRAYAPGPEGGLVDGNPARDDDVYLTDENRILVANATGTVRNVINPDFRPENGSIYRSQAISIAYHNPEAGDHSSPGGVAEQVGDGHATRDHSIAKNIDGHGKLDEFWIHFETDDLSEAIDVSPGLNQAEKFQNSALSLDVTQSNADGAPKVLNLSRNASGVSIFTDNGDSDPRIYNQTDQVGIFFGMLTNQVQFYQDGEPVELEVGDEFNATLSVNTTSGIETETTSFEIVAGETVYSEEELRLPQSESAFIQFNSTQAQGTAMGIRFAALDDEGNVIRETTTGEMTLAGQGQATLGNTAATSPWGTLTTTVNTSGLEVGTRIVAEARIVADLQDGDYGPSGDFLTVERINGTIRAPPSATVTIGEQTGSGDSVTISDLNLSDGGFVSLHTESPTGPTIGTSDYLEGGEYSDLEVSLDESLDSSTTVYAIVHLDTNGNEEYDFPTADDPYTIDGSAVTGSGAYTVESDGTPTATDTDTPDGTDTPTATDTAEPTSTPMDTPEETEEPTSTPTDTTDGGGLPGFGVGVALIALLAAALVALRRR